MELKEGGFTRKKDKEIEGIEKLDRLNNRRLAMGKKVFQKIKQILGIGLGLVLVYIMANFMGGNVYTGLYLKGYDERVETNLASMNLTDSYEGHLGAPVKFKGTIVQKIEGKENQYVLQVGTGVLDTAVAIVKNESKTEINEGDILEINGFYAGKKVIKLNEEKFKLPVIDTIIVEEINSEELVASISEVRTYERELNVQREGKSPDLFISLNWIEKYKENSLIEFDLLRSGEGMSRVKELKVEKYEREKLLETQNMELLNYEITGENDMSNLITVRCDSNITKVKIILEYTDERTDEIKTDIVEVEIPEKVFNKY